MGHVLVTGATGGIGTALVRALAKAGHQVTAIGRDAGRLDVPTIEADLARPEMLAAAVRELPDVQALIHCAGVSPIAAVADAGPQLWERTLAVRPYDPERCIQPETLAEMIVWALSAPADAYACELSVVPAPR
ncbi:SDR family NAD(P)-dependent oxidoreductase [Nonomuraea sp. 3N208]|uniref:SDR family NAD(P)-dependent oxidoreductase n=1 Tax=Nonomuraea sp. 3N208 TaxID=3457421 RepID=UPI003FD08BF4